MKSIPVLISASSWASRVLAGSLHADLGMAEKNESRRYRLLRKENMQL